LSKKGKKGEIFMHVKKKPCKGGKTVIGENFAHQLIWVNSISVACRDGAQTSPTGALGRDCDLVPAKKLHGRLHFSEDIV